MVDTGGLIFDEDQDNLFAPQIREQALLALDEAVAAILVVDGQVSVMYSATRTHHASPLARSIRFI